MKINDLKRYKPLDITELPGEKWNTAEKVLGLDENDKVIMAEPDGVVTPEDVADAVNQAMEAETARTEDAYAKKDEIPDMEDYYTKEEVDDAIAAIPEPDLSDYYTKGETDGAISTALVPYATKGWVSSQSYANQNYVMFKVNEAMQIETARTESTYAKPSDIPSLDDYATEQYVDNAVSSATQDMATEQYVNDAIAAIPGVDLSDYALISSVTADINTAIANETARTESTYAKPSQIPSLDGYATEQWVESQGYLTEHQDLSAYAKTTAVTQDIQTAMAAETARTESTYLKEHQSLDNYYTKSEVDADFVSAATEVGNAIDAAVDGLASETYVDNAVAGLATEEYVDNAVAGIVFPDDYATTGDVANAVEGLASESYVNDAITSATEGMATQSDLEGLASQEYVDNAVNDLTLGIGMLGMVNDVSESNGTVTVRKTGMQDGQIVTGSTSFNIATPGDIQTAIASETARTESTYLKEHQSLDNYYTKSQVDAEITGATEDMATKTWVGQQGYLTQHQDLSAYAKTTAVTEDIASAMAAETARTESTYAKPSQIPSLAGYATETYVDNAMASETARTESTYLKEHQDISGKLDKTDFDTYTGATETVLAGKVDVADLPTAQDDSDFNQFVYNGSDNKAVLSKFFPNYKQNITSNNRQSQITFSITTWGGSRSQYSVNLPKGNECVDGVKTDRDSQVISKAEEALNGFTEQITLTLGNRSATDKISMALDLYLYETNYPRYLAIPTSEAIVGMIQRVILSGTAYYVQNPISQDNYRPVTGKYQLGTRNTTFNFNKEVVGNTYIIIDTELLTLEIADSLTITRAKSIPEAISAATQNMVTSGDVATQIDTAMASETARTESTYAKPSDIPSLSGYATETWVQNQGYLTQHQDISGKLDKTDFNTYTGATQTILAGKADVGDIPTVPTNVSAFTNDAGYLTQHQSLANYYTKTEIDGMIGDIESLLASI